MKKSPCHSIYLIDKKEKLITCIFKGEISVEDVILGLKTIVKDEAFNKSFNFLIDFSASTFNSKQGNVEKTMDFLQQAPQLLSQKKVALVTQTPLQVAITTIFSAEMSSYEVKPNIFSTLKSAHRFLSIQKPLKIIENDILRLNSQL